MNSGACKAEQAAGAPPPTTISEGVNASQRCATKILGYETHEATDLFPLLEGKAFDALVENIKQNGQLHPVILHAGKILDGRNRARACKVLNIELRTAEWDGMGKGPTAWVMATNFQRRDLTPSQRALIAAEALPLFEREAHQRQRDGGAKGGSAKRAAKESAPGRSAPEAKSPRSEKKAASEAASAAGVSTRSVERAKAVMQKAPELVEKVRSGEVPLKTASEAAGGKAQPSRTKAEATSQSGAPPAGSAVDHVRLILEQIRGLSRPDYERLMELLDIERNSSESQPSTASGRKSRKVSPSRRELYERGLNDLLDAFNSTLTAFDGLEARLLPKRFKVALQAVLDEFRLKASRQRARAQEWEGLSLAAKYLKAVEACEVLGMDSPPRGKGADLALATSKKKMLARQYHPDAVGHDRFRDQYQSVFDAYATLEDYSAGFRSAPAHRRA